MEKKLFMGQPLITGYPIHANISSILVQHPSYNNWIFTNHMQLRFDIYNNEFETDYFLEFYQPLMREYHPLLNIHSISKLMLSNLNINICDFFMQILDSNNYIYTLIDKQHISAYKTRKSSPHDLFVYGYNKQRNIFYVADYFQNFHMLSTASFEEIEKAVDLKNDYSTDSWDNIFGIQLIGINQWKKYDFNLEYFIQTLYDYLNSTNTSHKYSFLEGVPKERPELHGSLKPTFGIKIYNELCNMAGANFKFLRALHLLFEHKRLMTRRIEFLGGLNLIDDELYIKLFKEVEEKAIVIRNYMIKQIIKGDSSDTSKVKSMIMDLESIEYSYLEKLAKSLTGS
ncbi:hypothetical protein [Paenibacillus woosongensis]|uniref:Butirosin biosynthesis protein H N-terminal domain-containing protein n=1 Tax=Paenibacillus woosongensis TaxID=307580 RepID=A0A7X2Z1E2_9BACL|nr:hypothetical protein [Paenibacillus woosongensis]MUG45248.1 hypothetical protein [Paenibacillus woosongensis]